MNILHDLANTAAVLLTMREPYPEEYRHPTLDKVETDCSGRPVLHITAENYIDACSFTDGTTYPGDVTREIVHIDGDKWRVQITEWNNDMEERCRGKL